MSRRRTHIGYRLRRARKQMGYTQVDVMHALGLQSDDRIVAWEKGRKIPSLRNILKLAALYNTLTEELFYDEYQDAKRTVQTNLNSRKPESVAKNRPP